MEARPGGKDAVVASVFGTSPEMGRIRTFNLDSRKESRSGLARGGQEALRVSFKAVCLVRAATNFLPWLARESRRPFQHRTN